MTYNDRFLAALESAGPDIAMEGIFSALKGKMKTFLVNKGYDKKLQLPGSDDKANYRREQGKTVGRVTPPKNLDEAMQGLAGLPDALESLGYDKIFSFGTIGPNNLYATFVYKKGYGWITDKAGDLSAIIYDVVTNYIKFGAPNTTGFAICIEYDLPKHPLNMGYVTDPIYKTHPEQYMNAMLDKMFGPSATKRDVTVQDHKRDPIKQMSEDLQK